MKKLHMVTFLLLVVGGLNWLLVGLWNYDLVLSVLGVGIASMIVYVLIGFSALYELMMHGKCCKICKKTEDTSSPTPSMPSGTTPDQQPMGQ